MYIFRLLHVIDVLNYTFVVLVIYFCFFVVIFRSNAFFSSVGLFVFTALCFVLYSTCHLQVEKRYAWFPVVFVLWDWIWLIFSSFGYLFIVIFWVSWYMHVLQHCFRIFCVFGVDFVSLPLYILFGVWFFFSFLWCLLIVIFWVSWHMHVCSFVVFLFCFCVFGGYFVRFSLYICFGVWLFLSFIFYISLSSATKRIT